MTQVIYETVMFGVKFFCVVLIIFIVIAFVNSLIERR
jgi:type III secretory pathway component EscS